MSTTNKPTISSRFPDEVPELIQESMDVEVQDFLDFLPTLNRSDVFEAPFPGDFYLAPSNYSFLQVHRMQKAVETEIYFHLMSGQPDEARRLFNQIYLFNYLMARDSISNMAPYISASFLDLILDVAEVVYLDGHYYAEDLEAALIDIEQIRTDMDELAYLMPRYSIFEGQSIVAPRTRGLQARVAVLREAVAFRLFEKRHGRPPEDARELANAMGRPTASDPFCDHGGTIRIEGRQVHSRAQNSQLNRERRGPYRTQQPIGILVSEQRHFNFPRSHDEVPQDGREFLARYRNGPPPDPYNGLDYSLLVRTYPDLVVYTMAEYDESFPRPQNSIFARYVTSTELPFYWLGPNIRFVYINTDGQPTDGGREFPSPTDRVWRPLPLSE